MMAYDFAHATHFGQKRKNGDPYFKHPAAVAELVLEYKGHSKNLEVLLQAALLHDVIEDTSATYYQIFAIFGPLVASIVLELTTNPDLKNALDKKTYLAGSLKHMTHYALTIKLCDRLNNMSDFDGCEPEWIERYKDETRFIIDYLQKNRELSETQNRLIEAILNKIS